MRAFTVIALIGCGSPPDPMPVGPGPSPSDPTPTVRAGSAFVAPPKQGPIATLTRGGLGPITGDTLFVPGEIARALPTLSWKQIDGPNGARIVGSLGTEPIVVLRGFRFVEHIHVLSPQIASDLGAVVGMPAEHVPSLGFCHTDVDAYGDPSHMQLRCYTELSGATPVLDLAFDGEPYTRDKDPQVAIAKRTVVGIEIGVSRSQALIDKLKARPPRLAEDPVVAGSPLLVDKAAIHPITDLATVTQATLAKALPTLDVTATATGFEVAHKGLPVAIIETTAGRLTKLDIVHASVRSKLGVRVDQRLGDSDPKPTLACATISTGLAASCAIVDNPRIELSITASTWMPSFLGGADDYTGDAVITAIRWRPPRSPVWPVIGNDAVGALTAALASGHDEIGQWGAFPEFDRVGATTGDIFWFDGLVGKTKVFEYVQGGRLTLRDPHFKIAGTTVGPGSTIADALAANLAPTCTTFDADTKEPDRCSTSLSRIDLILDDSARGKLAPAVLAKRRIAAVRWNAQP